MKPRRYTPQEDAFFIQHWGRLPAREIAARLGHSPVSGRRHAAVLAKRGLIDFELRAGRRVWAAADLKWAVWKIERDGWPFQKVADALGRSEEALTMRLRVAGRRKGTKALSGILTLREVGRVMGTAGWERPRGWVESGALVSHRLPGASRAFPHRIYPGDFIEFLKSHPDCYEYDRIPSVLSGKPNPWRQYARRGRSGADGKLTVKQAARLLGLHPTSVARRCREGSLPAVRLTGPGLHPRDYWIEKDLVMELAGKRRRAA